MMPEKMSERLYYLEDQREAYRDNISRREELILADRVRLSAIEREIFSLIRRKKA